MFYAKWSKVADEIIETPAAPTVTCEKYKPIQTAEEYKYKVTLKTNISNTTSVSYVEYCVGALYSSDNCVWNKVSILKSNTIIVDPYVGGYWARAWIKIGNKVSAPGWSDCPRPTSGGDGGSGGSSGGSTSKS